VTAGAPEAGQVPNRSMPPGAVVPVLVYPDMAAAVRWLCAAFGFAGRLRIGDHRTQLLIGDGAAMVAVQGAPGAPAPDGQTCSVMVRVADVDRHYARARECGARIVQPPADYPYGERQYTADDLAGHRWTFTQSLADVDPAAWGGLLLG